MLNFRIFVVDDESSIGNIITTHINDMGHRAEYYTSAREAISAAQTEQPDIMLIDINMPDMNGLELLKFARENFNNMHCVLITGKYDSEQVVTALRSGAYDVLYKPLNLEQLSLVLERIGHEVKNQFKTEALKRGVPIYDFSDIIGDSQAMERAKSVTAKVAGSSANTILIRGETGTGKEVFARALHNNSPRRDEPFIEVNCSAIPSQLLESELFGHERGAFTDAKERKIGLIEQANGGTFFLDEIGDMDHTLQSKILRVLEERAIRRVGGSQKIQVNIRFIAATHKDLEAMVDQQTFREDLFFRLNVIQLDLPPLRDRGEDVLELADFFLERFNKEYSRELRGLTPSAKRAIVNYNWAGNVRELRNTIERVVLIEAEDWIEAEHLHLWRRRSARSATPEDVEAPRIGYDFDIPDEGFSIVEFEKILLSRAMKKARYNVSKAARFLGLSRETMRYRIKKHDLDLD
jgi:two-component system, NtrC family, response regulator AtoC